MKKIASIICMAAGLLAAAPALMAQTSAEGIVLDKHVTENPDENGVRWITLESFVTGAVKVVSKSVPSDVILVLDVSSSMGGSYPGYNSRLAALKESVNGFIDSIYENDQKARATDPEYDGNRIAILTYSSVVTDITEKAWYNVKNGVSDLESKVSKMTTNTGTRPDLGLEKAIDNYLYGSDNSARSDANLTVVLFTDGYPIDDASGRNNYRDGSGSTGFDYGYANDAIYYGNQIKNNYKAKLFTIGLITSVTPGNNQAYRNYSRVLQFMDWLSSNYPDCAINKLN